ncbi:hypothetical protein [Streptomyces sp. NPDC005125]
MSQPSTVRVEPADVRYLADFLQTSAGQGTDAVWGIEAMLELLQTIQINPGDPSVIPGSQTLLDTVMAVVKPLYEGLQVFGGGLKVMGEELAKVADGYTSAEELAQADVQDLGVLLAITDGYAQDSGGKMLDASQLPKNPPQKMPETTA